MSKIQELDITIHLTPLEFRIYDFLELNFIKGASESDILSHINDVSKEEIDIALKTMVSAGKIGVTMEGNALYFL